MPEKVFIYCLKDPTTGDVRYIGKTDDLKARFYAHLKTSSKKKNHLGNWLRSLQGYKPVLAVLHEVAENESWQEEERRYIFFARGMGVDLVNATDGGEGVTMTPEICKKISAATKGVPKSPEHNAKNSAAHKGVPKSPEHCAAMSAARKGVPIGPMPPEQRVAMRVPKSPEGRANMRGPKSPEHRAAISAALTGVPRGPMSPEQRAAISATTKGVPKTPEYCAARKGVPWSSARRAAHERRWGGQI